MVIGVKRPKDENGEESNALRVLTVHKCRKADERSFLYRKGEDGRLEPCMGAEIIGDLRSKITKWMLDRHDKGIPTASIDEIHEGVKGDGFGGTRKTIQNNLASLVRGKTPQLVRVEGKGKGIYRINPYWLRSNR